MAIKTDTLDQLLDGRDPKEVFIKDGLFDELKKALAERVMNAKLRRAVKIRGHFPNDEAATKLIYPVLRQTAAEWKMSPREWGEAKTQFAIMFEDRFVLA